jgi:hypothetical protein
MPGENKSQLDFSYSSAPFPFNGHYSSFVDRKYNKYWIERKWRIRKIENKKKGDVPEGTSP